MVVVVVYPVLQPLLVGGVRSSRLWFTIQLASSSVTPARSVHNSRYENVVCMRVQFKRWCVLCVCGCYRGGTVVIVRFGCDEWSISSELLMCGRGVRSILLLPFVVRFIETIDACIWRMLVFMSVVVIVWAFEGMFVV